MWNAADIGAQVQELGLAGSLTHVVKTFTPKEARENQFLEGSPLELASRLLEELGLRDIRLGD